MGINTAMYNGLSGLSCYGTALSVVSDNVANANTTAYKSNSVRFGDMVNSYYATLTSDTEREGAGVALSSFASDFGQGNITDTQTWTDLAVSGDGWFSVQDPTTGDTYYTRDGSFRLAGNEQTQDVVNGTVTTTYTYDFLVNQDGYYVLDSEGDPIRVSLGYTDDAATPADVTYTDYTVDTDGTVYGIDSEGSQVALVDLTGDSGGTVDPTNDTLLVGLTVFSNENGLIREGSNLYTAGVDSGTATLNGDTGADQSLYGNILDNSLEGSNVDLSTEMVNMIIYQASFNANSKTITTASSLLDTTVNMVR